MKPTLTGIDHVHLQVTNRGAAENWYHDVLGFERVEHLMAWAGKTGPLTIQDAGHSIHIALFERETPVTNDVVALGTTGADFLQWIKALEGHGLKLRLADHELAYSLYFDDPWGNQIEITTYDRDFVARELD